MEKRQRFLAHTPQQERFGFQDSEPPAPFRIGPLKSIAPPFGLFLGLCQIAMQKDLIGVTVRGLWAVAMVAAQSSGEQ